MPSNQSVRSLLSGLALSLSFTAALAQTTLSSTPDAPAPAATIKAPATQSSTAPTQVPAAQTAAPATPATGTSHPPAAQTPVPAGQTAAPGAPAPAATQEATDDPGYTFKTSVSEVNLIFTVTDKHGHFINNLLPKDFALLDDQKPPAQLYSFTQQTNLPLRVGLLIDASTSIRLRFKFEQQAATEFLLEVLRPRTDRAFVMAFNGRASVVQDFTNNPDLLSTGINKIQPAGGTALYDAVYTACRDKLLSAAPSQANIRKAIIVVSDGEDNQSRAYLDDAIKMCQRAQAIVYTISTNDGPTRGRGDDTLSKISLATGGTTFFPKRLEDIANDFTAVQNELRSQYALAYKPSDFKTDGSFRTIYFEALDRRYTVRAPKGYFATQ